MIQQKFRQEKLVKAGAPQREEPLTSHAKNTTLHLNGQNIRLAAKNGRNSKTPGLHLSAAYGEEAAGRLTPAVPTQEGTVQLDLLLLRSPLPDSQREGENLPPRRPVKLAPLELTEAVREAQRQKMKSIQQEAKAASRKLDVAGSDPCPRKVKPKAPGCPLVPVDASGKSQQHPKAPRPLLHRAAHVQPQGERHLEEVVCRGVPAPVCGKPAPPATGAKAHATRGADISCQNGGTFQEDAGRRRLRLRRAERLEEDQGKVSTGGLSGDECKVAQGLHGKGQRAEKALKDASRMLERASKRNQAEQPPEGMEVSGRAIRRMAVSNLQDLVV